MSENTNRNDLNFVKVCVDKKARRHELYKLTTKIVDAYTFAAYNVDFAAYL